MLSLVLGLTAFALYFIYDINSITRQYRPLHYFFAIGSLLLAAATVLDIVAALKNGAIAGLMDYVLLTGAVLCFGALIYCLFFALPFQETYADDSKLRPVYSGGVYGRCRHPGILCFFGMELLLGLAALPTGMLVRGMIFSALNLTYAYFQDKVSFPETFCDYRDYQQKVPFLIPRIGKALLQAEKEEVEV